MVLVIATAQTLIIFSYFIQLSCTLLKSSVFHCALSVRISPFRVTYLIDQCIEVFMQSEFRRYRFFSYFYFRYSKNQDTVFSNIWRYLHTLSLVFGKIQQVSHILSSLSDNFHWLWAVKYRSRIRIRLQVPAPALYQYKFKIFSP